MFKFMDLKSKQSPVIDFTGHIVLNIPDVGEMVEIDNIIGSIHSSPTAVLERIQQSQLDGMVLSQPPYIGSSNTSAVRRSNDELHNIVSKYDEFFGLAALPVGAGSEAAVEELERCLEMGFNGAAIETKSNGIKASDNDLIPLFELANNSETPILVHPKLHNSVGQSRDHLKNEYRLNAILGRELALIETICEFIHKGIYDQFKNLNLVYHHLGGNIASMLGRLALHFDLGRWPNQSKLKSYGSFKDQLRERVYIDTAGFLGFQPPLTATLNEFPASQILFGSDSPYEPRSVSEMNKLVDTIRSNTSKTNQHNILGQNTLDLLVNI